ncbi:fimbrial protein [[Erwinia] mediterraneensis]|uniref:fimbrial protein n=1 Tax=[Erwinia] mediterraneensis TaxID=2161819 RepID=UPI0010314024|nr:fimbrial protein [[Erwinia] mediterraneensis]
MKSKKLAMYVALLSMTGASWVNAADTLQEGQGTVTFNGKLQNETCRVADDSKDIIVTLPTLATASLPAAGAEAGTQKFSINVNSCPPSMSQVAAHFEAIGSSGMNSATGNLKNSADAATAANNVEIRLYDFDAKHLALGNSSAPQPVEAGTHTASLAFYGGYYATGATTAGDVLAKAKFTLSYP